VPIPSWLVRPGEVKNDKENDKEMAARYMTKEEMDADNDTLDDSFVVIGAITQCKYYDYRKGKGVWSTKKVTLFTKDNGAHDGYGIKMLETATDKNKNFFPAGVWYGDCPACSGKKCDPDFLDNWYDASYR
jgi:hypothetical protein